MLKAKRIYQGSPITSSTGTVCYTVPSGKSCIIKNIIQANKTNKDAVITMYLVPNGETKGSQHEFISHPALSANDTRFIEGSIVMHEGDKLISQQTTASAINLYISGMEYDD